VRSWIDQTKTLAYTILVSATVIASLVLAAFVIPLLIGIGIVMVVYISIRVINEDIDD
jgi:CHASE3 domain sensor protein